MSGYDVCGAARVKIDWQTNLDGQVAGDCAIKGKTTMLFLASKKGGWCTSYGLIPQKGIVDLKHPSLCEDGIPEGTHVGSMFWFLGRRFYE